MRDENVRVISVAGQCDCRICCWSEDEHCRAFHGGTSMVHRTQIAKFLLTGWRVHFSGVLGLRLKKPGTKS